MGKYLRNIPMHLIGGSVLVENFVPIPVFIQMLSNFECPGDFDTIVVFRYVVSNRLVAHAFQYCPTTNCGPTKQPCQMT